MMNSHLTLTDLEFEQQFASCRLDPKIFGHEAHLRLAWIHVRKYGEEAAIESITSQLQAFVEHVGAKDKYNHTLTIAAIKAVSHFIKRSKVDTFQEFIQEHPRLMSNFKDLMNTHYQVDIFTSEKAKKEFVEPDLMPFD